MKKVVKAVKKHKKDEAGVFAGDDFSSGSDAYNTEDMSSKDLKELDSFAAEEKKAFSSPLKASEMKTMEKGGDALFKEITAGLKGVSDEEYEKAKKFFEVKDD